MDPKDDKISKPDNRMQIIPKVIFDFLEKLQIKNNKKARMPKQQVTVSLIEILVYGTSLNIAAILLRSIQTKEVKLPVKEAKGGHIRLNIIVKSAENKITPARGEANKFEIGAIIEVCEKEVKLMGMVKTVADKLTQKL